MKEKLSFDEIEERKKQNILETAKMNSCISGIPLSDLIDSTFRRRNYGEKDCLIKQQFLKNLVEPVTSRELYETLKHQGYSAKYSTFKGLLYRYQKYKYVVKLNDKKPFIYGLTELGYQHIKNPYLAREEIARQRLNFIYSQIEKELVDHPEALKNLVETISQMNLGSSNYNPVIVGAGSQYSSNDLGSEKLKDELNAKIFNREFFKNSDESKLKLLVDGILNDSLSYEEKQELMMDAFNEAVNSHKGSILLQHEYNPSKTIGMRNYYPTIINAIDKPVTESVYQEIPFRFIYISKKNELRLESEAIAGKYKNNQDGVILSFSYVNRQYFSNAMTVKANKSNDDEISFYYASMGNRSKPYKITTMSIQDYEKAKGKVNGIKLKINS